MVGTERRAMKVFITGAGGYIGSAVAAAFARAGHDVYGLVRSEKKGVLLARSEVRPVVGSLEQVATFSAVAEDCHVIIHCATEYSPNAWEFQRNSIDSLINCARRSRLARKFISTSGVWVYGDTGGAIADETSLLNPPAFVAPRPAIDEMVLRANNDAVKTTVIRPGCVYGGSGSLTALWFESAAKEGAARVVGDGNFRWAMVHREDLADLYVRTAESPWGGEIFNATDRSRFTVLECARAASVAAGAGGKVQCVPVDEAKKMFGPMADCLALDQHVDSRKAVRMLGWQPHHGGFVDGAARYFTAWKAAAASGEGTRV